MKAEQFIEKFKNQYAKLVTANGAQYLSLKQNQLKDSSEKPLVLTDEQKVLVPLLEATAAAREIKEQNFHDRLSGLSKERVETDKAYVTKEEVFLNRQLRKITALRNFENVVVYYIEAVNDPKIGHMKFSGLADDIAREKIKFFDEYNGRSTEKSSIVGYYDVSKSSVNSRRYTRAIAKILKTANAAEATTRILTQEKLSPSPK